MTIEEFFDALLNGTLPAAPVTFSSLYQEPTETTLFDVDERWIDVRLVNERRAAPSHPADLRNELRDIERSDPDGGSVQPTEADYARHEDASVQAYGREVWDIYRAGGWEPAPTWI